MRFALLNDKRIEATKGAKGVCPCCGSELVAKCGEIKVHHWSHKKKCDDHWWENETEWHRNWKDKFPKEWQEIIQKDESGEKHIADVKTSSGWVIEFQHSAIAREERDSRDYFYNKLIWIVDGTRRTTDIKQFQNEIKQAHIVYYLEYPEDYRLIREWGSSQSLVFVDFGTDELWLIYNDDCISAFSRNSFVELMNNTQSDEVYKVLLDPIQKQLDENKAEQEKIRREQEEKDRIRGQKFIEEDLRIRKKYDMKDDEEWFEGSLGIKIFKRYGEKIVYRRPKPKIPYVIGICRNRFHYFDIKVASSILNNYVEVMKKLDYSDEQIEDEFDINVIPKTMDVKNWTEWKNLMEQLKQRIGKR
jgi:hypothetical protein